MRVPTLTGDTIEYRKCIASDVNNHYELLRNAVDDVPEAIFIDRMHEAISTDTAWCLYDGSVFIYLIKHKENYMEGAVFYGLNKPFEILALMMAIMTIHNPVLKKVKFRLHEKTTHRTYRSILTRKSLINHHKHSDPLMVDCIELRKKLYALYEKTGVSWAVS